MEKQVKKLVWIFKNIDKTRWVLSFLSAIGVVIGARVENLPTTIIVVLAIVIFTTFLYLVPAVRGWGGKRLKSVRNKTYSDQEITLHKLVAPDEPVITNCSFNECVIRGPCIIVLEGGTMFHGHTRFSNLPSMADALISVGNKKVIYGAILLNSCTFRDCTFKEVGIAGRPDTLKSLEAWMKKDK